MKVNQICKKIVQIVITIVLIVRSAPLKALVPLEYEAEHLNAVLLLRQGNLDAALSKVDEVLKKIPDVPELLELKALALRGKNDNTQAREVYNKLIALYKDEEPRTAAPYHFELGMVAYEEKQFEEAKQQFKLSLQWGFNVATSHFYLGLMDVDKDSYISAKRHFEKTLLSKQPNLQLPSRLHLAQIEQKLNNKVAVARHYYEARQLAMDVLDDPRGIPEIKNLARRALATFEKTFKSYSESALLASVGLYGGYDSNVLYVPHDSISSDSSSVSAVTGTLRYGLGYMTPPLSKIQWIPYYSGTINYVGSPNNKGGQFYNHDITVQAIKAPLSLSNYGAQLSLNGTLQSRDEGSGYKFAPLDSSISLGPFARWDIGGDMVVGGGLFFKVSQNYLDHLIKSTEKRAGWSQNVTLFLANVTTAKFWNPVYSVVLNLDQASGTVNRNFGFDMFLSNPMYITDKLAFVQGLGMSLKYYHSRPGTLRSDAMPTLSVMAIYKVLSNLSALAQVKYTQNYSTDVSNRNHRLFATLGASMFF